MTIGGSLRHLRVDDVLQSNTWTHVAGTYDGSVMKLYHNGQPIADETVSGDLGSGNSVQLSHTSETLDGMLDEVVVMRRALDAGEIEALAGEAPQLILTLDEATATTQFADDSGNGNTATCYGSECPAAGVKGQLGLAANFDGVNDAIDIAHTASEMLMPDNAMTLVAWVKATDPDVDQKIVGKAAGSKGYVLGLKDGQLYPEIWDSSSVRYSAQWGRINPDTWTFLAITWETGGEMIGYINGEVAGRIDAGSLPIGFITTPFRVGAAPWNDGIFNVNGRVDHVLLYHHALSPREMRQLFRLQAKWVEERQSTDITVDAEAPVSALISDDVYRPNEDMMLLVSTEDATSPVTLLEIGINANNAGYVWESAPECQTTVAILGGSTAWCPTFEPTVGEGRYLIQLRATDNVGNREVPAQTYTFLVDDTPPDPLTALQEGELIQAEPRPNATWLVPLSGTITDPDIAGTTEPGSGVADVRVRLTATAHPTDTLAPRTAALDNGNWTIDYPLPFADATGTYTLSVRGSDNVGNVGDFTALVTIGLDTSPPVASLDGSNTMTVPITSTLTLTGRITETGVLSSGVAGVRVGFTPMAMQAISGTVATFHLDEAPTASAFRSSNTDAAVCEEATCPTAGISGVWGTALDFDGDAYLVADFVSEAVTDTDGFSFGAWINPVDDGSSKAVLAFNAADGSNRNQLIRANYRYCYYDGEVGRKCSTLHAGIDDTWRLVMVSITEEGHGTLYIDGVEGLTFETSARPEPDGRFSIGQKWDGGSVTDLFTGKIDEAVVYNRALTAEEVNAFYGDATLDSSGDGVIESDWQLNVPAGLEGLYVTNLRPSDVFSNTPDSDWEVWNGEIDIRAPRVKMTVEENTSNLSIRTTYTCWAQDFNLVNTSEEHPEYDFSCPCQTLAPLATIYTPTYYHEASPWYSGAFTDTNRLYQLEASCTVVGPALADSTMKACDIYGHCAEDIGEASEIVWLSPIDSGVLTPTLNSIITSTAPLLLEGSAYARDYVVTMTVKVDNLIIDTKYWSPLSVTNTTWTSTWLVPTEGEHVLTTRVIDGNGEDQDFERPVKVIVDIAPPFINIDPLVLTTTHRLSQDRVALTGGATDTNGVSTVEVKVEDEEWQEASLYGTDWQLDWYLGEEPAGKNYSITARAIDAAGHTTRVTQTVFVNLETPNPITLTLRSEGDVVTPGLTLRDLPATLDLSWITETQQADLLPYEVVWTVYTTETQAIRMPVPAEGPLTAPYIAGEAQRIRPQVISRLLDGNNQSDVYGTVTVDSRLTPDYISLETTPGERRPYLGWMESGCTQLGVDRRVAENAPGSAALDDPQKLYATWDSEALRLAWTGANWSYAGDLFIYLDTTTGGALQAMNPYSVTTGAGVQFPDDLNFGADVLIWVEDATTAHLLTWNISETDWDTQRLSPDQFRFEPGLNGGQTDLYLPFDMVGIDNPATAPLALVAFATEENEMALWGTMPPANPVNSPRVVETDVFAPEDVTFGLTQVYVWPILAPGMCPSSPYGDADVRLELSVEPAGTAYSFLGNDLFWLWEELYNEQRSADISKALTFLDVDHPLLKDGDTITYTLKYVNQGTEIATGIEVLATGLYALRFGGAITHVISLGDIGPGVSGTVAFQGEVDREAARTLVYEPCLDVGSLITCAQFLNWAVMEATVVDPIHGLGMPLDTLWASHEVDGLPPIFFGIQQPQLFINPGLNTFGGYAFDPSGVPTLTLLVETPPAETTCTDPTPDDGRWECQWDATQANGGSPPADGDTLMLELLATDGAGIAAGALSKWRTFIVDATPPEAGYDAETTEAYSGTVVAETSLTFSGVISDNNGVDAIEVCLNGECSIRTVQASGQASSVITDAATTPAQIPSCPSAITRTFEVADTFAIGEVQLGINADHERRNDVQAALTSPEGTVVQVLGPRPGTPFEAANYDVWLFDSASAGLHEVKVSDDTDIPIYDREARPYSPLRAFQGEGAAGTWTLSLCDGDPITKTGTYNRSELTVIPRNTAATDGTWAYTAANLDDIDGVPYTVEAYAIDIVGNRGHGITLTFELDNVAPALAATQRLEIAELTRDREPIRVLDGTVTDGGSGAVRMYAFVKLPSGGYSSRQVGQGDGTWWFDLKADTPGVYKIWINAMDDADNTATTGPVILTVVQLTAVADSPVATGAQAALTATLTGDTGFDFSWNPGDSTAPLAGATATHAYTTIGVFTATVTATKGTHAFTATTAVEAVEAVLGLAVVNDSPTVVSDTTTLTATVAAGSDVAFTWDLGDGTLTYGSVVRHVYPVKDSYTAVVTATNKVSMLTATSPVYVGISPEETTVYLPLVMRSATGLSR